MQGSKVMQMFTLTHNGQEGFWKAELIALREDSDLSFF